MTCPRSAVALTRLSAVCGLATAFSSCAQPRVLDVALVNPCNQDALREVDFLRFEPRGEDVDSTGLTFIQRVADGAALPRTIPPTRDFQMVVTGHRTSIDTPPAGIGVSRRVDLTAADGTVSLRVPFALVDRYHQTTDLADAKLCTTMSTARYGHTATWLPGPQIVLIVGGITQTRGAPEYRQVIESYDPKTGKFKSVGELRQADSRAYHTATKLDDNRVLISGGVQEFNRATESLSTAVVIDATNPQVAKVGAAIIMLRKRTGHAAARLSDGRVLLLGGRRLNLQAVVPEDHDYVAAIEIYDPDAGLFVLPPDASGLGVIELSTARYGHTATVLGSGLEVLVAGGFNGDGPQTTLEVVIATGETIESVTATTSDRLAVGPMFHAATLTRDEHVLLAGGYVEITDAEPRGASPINPTDEAEIWDYRPSDRRLARRCRATMNTARGFFTATTVGRRVLFAGGHQSDGASSALTEVVTVTGGAGCFATTPATVEMSDSRARHTATPLPSGEVLIAGGMLLSAGAAEGHSRASAEIFSSVRAP